MIGLSTAKLNAMEYIGRRLCPIEYDRRIS